MSVTFDSTPGGASATSLVTLADVADYFQRRPGPAAAQWSALTNAKKENAAMMGTLRVEQLADDIDGWLADPTSQALRSFPRSGVWDPVRGLYYDDTTIPDAAKWAVCEIIATYLANDATLVEEDSRQLTGLEAFESITAGPVTLTMRDLSSSPARDPLPIAATRWLRSFLRVASGQFRIQRG